MSIVTMDMSSYEIEHSDTGVAEYGDEVMCAGWVPALGLCEAQPEHAETASLAAQMDVDAFLRKMYRWQR